MRSWRRPAPVGPRQPLSTTSCSTRVVRELVRRCAGSSAVSPACPFPRRRFVGRIFGIEEALADQLPATGNRGGVRRPACSCRPSAGVTSASSALASAPRVASQPDSGRPSASAREQAVIGPRRGAGSPPRRCWCSAPDIGNRFSLRAQQLVDQRRDEQPVECAGRMPTPRRRSPIAVRTGLTETNLASPRVLSARPARA